MTQARFILTFASRPLAEAQQLADTLDEHIAIDALAVTVNETDESLALWNTIAYFADDFEAEAARSLMGEATAEITPLQNEDWVRKSLLGLPPVAAGRFFLHGSHDRDKRRNGGFSFEIDAGTAFGTGHHGTTAGCLSIFDSILKHTTPRHIFDLGCGTGVLAIAAARASGRRVLATDIDAEAVRVTRNNAALNRVTPLINAVTAAGLHHPAIRQAGPFDLVFANILARPLVSLAQGITQLLQPGGTVILSGLTRDQLRWVSAAYKSRGLVPTHEVRNENWMAVAMRKPSEKTKRPRKGRGHFEIQSRGPGWQADL